MLVPLESSSAVLVMICSKYVSICNHSRSRLVETRDSTLSYGEDPESLSHLALNPSVPGRGRQARPSVQS